MKPDEIQKIKKKMRAYCAYQERCIMDVRKKMSHYPLNSSEQEAILSELIKDNFLNEERFARAYARGKFHNNKWGKMKIAQGLKSKNIGKELINKALEEIEDEEYYYALCRLVENKLRSLPSTDEANYQKLYSFLHQKGYEDEWIENVLGEYL